MNNKGFTLIELIATIALLALIAVISFVSINKVLENHKIENCKTLKNNIIAATNEYVSDHRYGNIDVSNFDAGILVSNHYLKEPIMDPFSNEAINANDIKITVDLNDNYTMASATITSPSVLVNCSG